MKTALVLLFSFATFAVAQDSQAVPTKQDSEAVPAKRVKSVTWDLQNQTLVWVVQNGVAKNGQFVPSSEERYEISPKDQTMSFEGQQRGFTEDEAVWLQRVLNALSVYCAESVVWWLRNDGEAPPDGGPTAAPDDKSPAQHDSSPKRIKILDRGERKAPGTLRLVAQNLVY